MADDAQASLEDKVAQVIRARNQIIEAEVARLLPMWPDHLDEPCLVYGPDHQFLGLGLRTKIGEPGMVVLRARPIVLEINT